MTDSIKGADELEGLPQGEVFSEGEQDIHNKILFLLNQYPIISGAMLQMGLGPAVSAKLWRPIYIKMLQEREIKEESKPVTNRSGRYQNLTRISLRETNTLLIDEMLEKQAEVTDLSA